MIGITRDGLGYHHIRNSTQRGKTMKFDRLASIYSEPGPFASAYLEVSRDQSRETGLSNWAYAPGEELATQGAPAEVVDQVEQQLLRSTGQPAPISRCVVATERGVLFDKLTRTHHAQPVISRGPLPDVAAWLSDASRQILFILALVDHEGGDVTTYRPMPWSPSEAICGRALQVRAQGPRWRLVPLELATPRRDDLGS